MRILPAILFLLLLATRLEACDCATPGTPCSAAGIAAAAFTGTVLDIVFHPAIFPAGTGAARLAVRDRIDQLQGLTPAFRAVRMRVGEVLSGVAPGQNEIEIATGLGEADCGYPFQLGMDYVVYAFKNGEGRLEAGLCSRTRPVAQAPEDLKYFQAMAGAPLTSDLRVLTAFPGIPGKAGETIVAEREGVRYRAQTNSGGDARFPALPPGEYRIHAEADGDLPDDPKVQVYAKGCAQIMLPRTLRIIGRVTTRDGLPAAGVTVQVRSTPGIPGDSRMTGADGHYELGIVRSGQYYLGINLDRSPTRDTPYSRWFYPGIADPASAATIDFSGKPDTRTYDFVLPDRQHDRVIEGVVLASDGRPMAQARLAVFDSTGALVASAIGEQDGRFVLHVFAEISYRLHAVWPGDRAGTAVSAVPTDIPAGSNPLSLTLVLTQQGNSLSP